MTKREENPGGMSVREVEQAIKLKHKGFGQSRSTIQHYVVNEGNIPAVMYKSLCAAFGSCMRINQINALGGDNSRSKMIPLIAATMNFSISAATDLVRRLCRDTAIDMKADKMYFAEERRVRWTTYSNLELWVSTWEKTLLDLGLLEQGEDGKVYIPNPLLRNILHFDEMCLSLDGCSVNREGCPAAYYYDPRLPQVGISTSKTSQTITMITGSNAWGEVLPPHFQFMTSAQTDEGKQIRNECDRYLRRTKGIFGLGEEKSLPAYL